MGIKSLSVGALIALLLASCGSDSSSPPAPSFSYTLNENAPANQVIGVEEMAKEDLVTVQVTNSGATPLVYTLTVTDVNEPANVATATQSASGTTSFGFNISSSDWTDVIGYGKEVTMAVTVNSTDLISRSATIEVATVSLGDASYSYSVDSVEAGKVGAADITDAGLVNVVFANDQGVAAPLTDDATVTLSITNGVVTVSASAEVVAGEGTVGINLNPEAYDEFEGGDTLTYTVTVDGSGTFGALNGSIDVEYVAGMPAATFALADSDTSVSLADQGDPAYITITLAEAATEAVEAVITVSNGTPAEDKTATVQIAVDDLAVTGNLSEADWETFQGDAGVTISVAVPGYNVTTAPIAVSVESPTPDASSFTYTLTGVTGGDITIANQENADLVSVLLDNPTIAERTITFTVSNGIENETFDIVVPAEGSTATGSLTPAQWETFQLASTQDITISAVSVGLTNETPDVSATVAKATFTWTAGTLANGSTVTLLQQQNTNLVSAVYADSVASARGYTLTVSSAADAGCTTAPTAPVSVVGSEAANFTTNISQAEWATFAGCTDVTMSLVIDGMSTTTTDLTGLTVAE